MKLKSKVCFVNVSAYSCFSSSTNGARVRLALHDFFSSSSSLSSLSLSLPFSFPLKHTHTLFRTCISNMPSLYVLTDDYHIRTRQGRREAGERASERRERNSLTIVSLAWGGGMVINEKDEDDEQEDESLPIGQIKQAAQRSASTPKFVRGEEEEEHKQGISSSSCC